MSALQGRREIAIRGKHMARAQKETHSVPATMTVNVEKIHAHPLPLLSRRRKSMRKLFQRQASLERSVHRVRGSWGRVRITMRGSQPGGRCGADKRRNCADVPWNGDGLRGQWEGPHWRNPESKDARGTLHTCTPRCNREWLRPRPRWERNRTVAEPELERLRLWCLMKPRQRRPHWSTCGRLARTRHTGTMRNTSQLSCVRRDGCHDRMDRVDRPRLVEPCGSRDDSLCCCFKSAASGSAGCSVSWSSSPRRVRQDARQRSTTWMWRDVQAGNEQLIGRRFSVVRKRRMEEMSHSDDVTQKHQVMRKRDWPEKVYSCKKVWIHLRIARRVKRRVPSVKVTRGDDVEDKMMTQETSSGLHKQGTRSSEVQVVGRQWAWTGV